MQFAVRMGVVRIWDYEDENGGSLERRRDFFVEAVAEVGTTPSGLEWTVEITGFKSDDPLVVRTLNDLTPSELEDLDELFCTLAKTHERRVAEGEEIRRLRALIMPSKATAPSAIEHGRRLEAAIARYYEAKP